MLVRQWLILYGLHLKLDLWMIMNEHYVFCECPICPTDTEFCGRDWWYFLEDGGADFYLAEGSLPVSLSEGSPYLIF